VNSIFAMAEGFVSDCLEYGAKLPGRIEGYLDFCWMPEKPAILLDEPVAAIDVMEEKRIYEQFMQMCKGKTALIVTHRLASTRPADRIVVMDKGRCIGFGTHGELLSKRGKYREMWEEK